MEQFKDLLKKHVILLGLILIMVMSIALANMRDNYVSIYFDKDSYEAGEVVKISAVTSNKPTNPNIQFVVVGTQINEGISKPLFFKKFNNIFKGITEKISESTSVKIVVKLENSLRILEIDQKIHDLQTESRALETQNSHDPNVETQRKIQEIQNLLRKLKSERLRQSVVVQELNKVINVNPEEGDQGGSSGGNSGGSDNGDFDYETAYSDMEISTEGINEQNFNPTSLNIKLKTSSESGFFQNEIGYTFQLNGEPIETTGLAIQKNEISFNFSAQEGENSLLIEGHDGGNRIFIIEKTFFAGSRTVSVNVTGSSSAGELSVYLPNYQDFKVLRTFTAPSFTLENVPNLPVVLSLETEAGEFSYETLDIDESTVSLAITSGEEPSPVQNDDFSIGSEGWNVTSGTALVENRVINGSPLPNDKDLIVSLDDYSKIELKRSFYAATENKYVTIKFDLQASEEDEIHVVLKNDSTHELVHKVFLGKNYTEGTSQMFNAGESVSVKALNANDVVSFHLKLIRRNTGKRLAFNEEKSINSKIRIDNVSRRNFSLKSFYAHNLIGGIPPKVSAPFKYEKKLNYVGIGKLPSALDNFVYRIPINFEFENTGRIKKVSLVLSQPFTGVSVESHWEVNDESIEQIANYNNSLNDYKGRFVSHAIEKIAFDRSELEKFTDLESPLLLYFYVHIDDGFGGEEVYPFELGRWLTPLEYRENESIAYMPSKLGRESDIGGDQWGQHFAWNLLLNIFSHEDNKGFRINDLSKILGGHFAPHFDHEIGTEVDYNFPGDNFVSVKNGPPKIRFTNPKAITDTFEVLNESPVSPTEKVMHYVHEVIISHNSKNEQFNPVSKKWMNNPENGMSDLKRNARAGCTIDNRPVSSVIRHATKHVDHGHIVFKKKRTSSLEVSNFRDFRIFNKEFQGNKLRFDFEVTPTDEFFGDEIFVWDIRKRDGTIVEVIDSQTSNFPTNGTLSQTSSDFKKFTYAFPDAGEYLVSVTVIRTVAGMRRCVSQSMDVIVTDDPEEIVNCPNEWQTRRGRESVDELSGHQHLAGAFVSKDTIWEVGRFFVEGDSAGICGQSEVRDSYAKSDGCTEENKYSCASVLLSGLVGVLDSKIDATQGRVQIAGTDKPFAGYHMIPPTDPENGVGNDINVTLITDSIVNPKGDSPMVIINSDIDGDGGTTIIQDSAFVQQANVWWGTVAGESLIKGGTISGVKNPELSYEPQITVKGKSVIRSYVGSQSRLDIVDSTLEDTSQTFGGGLINKSLLQGAFFGADVNPSEFNTTRIAKLDDSAVTVGNVMGDRAQILNQAVLGSGLPDENYPSHVGYDVTIKNGAWVFGGSNLIDDVSISGAKVKAFSIRADTDTNVDSSLGGTRNILLLDSVNLSETTITGTPQISGSYIFRASVRDDAILKDSQLAYGTVADKAEAYNSILGVLGFGEKSIVVSGEAKVYDSWVSEKGRVSGQAIVSGRSSVAGTAIVHGTAHVTNACDLNWGNWISGVYSGNTYPCGTEGPARNISSVFNPKKNSFSEMKRNCRNKSVLKAITNKKKKKAYLSFSNTCNNMISLAERKNKPRRKFTLEEMRELEKSTRAMIEKSLSKIR